MSDKRLIERPNGSSIELVPTKKKGGGIYMCPEITEESLPNLLVFFKDDLLGFIRTGVKKLCQVSQDEATSEDGTMDWSVFDTYIRDGAIQSESKSDLEERRDELTEQIINIEADFRKGLITKNEADSKMLGLISEQLKLHIKIQQKSKPRKPKTVEANA